MINLTTIKGMIQCMEMMGAEFKKIERPFIYFDIKINSEIDDEQKLLRSNEAFHKMFGLKLKIKRV